MAKKKATPPAEQEPDESAPAADKAQNTAPAPREQPLEELINEWEAEDPQLLADDSGETAVPGPGPSASRMPAGIRADDYQRISPEEIDEFDSLLDEGLQAPELGRLDAEPPQLPLLMEEDAVDLAPVAEGASLADPSSPPVDLVDADPLPSEQPLPQPGETDSPPPDFEDKPMGAGFFVPEDELQAAGGQQPIEEPASKEGGEETDQGFAADIFFPPGPTVEEHQAPVVVGDLPADTGVVENAVTDDRITRLMNRAEQARKRINEEIDSIELARELLELIRSGTTLILSGKANYEEAERSLNEVEYRLSYSKRVKVWSDAIAYKLLAYEVGWLLFMGLGALFIPSLLSALIGQLNTFVPTSLPDFIQMDDLFLGVSTALWGGLGGVVGAMYSLWRHVSLKQDFNPQHKMWYYTQPIMGIPIGVVVFMLVRIGIGFTVDGVLDFASPYGIYMVAWTAGFQQNILYEVIRQILKLFRLPK